MWTDAQLENWRLRQRQELATPSFLRRPDDVHAHGSHQRIPPSAGPCPDIIRVKRKRGPVLSNEPMPEDDVDDLWR